MLEGNTVKSDHPAPPSPYPCVHGPEWMSATSPHIAVLCLTALGMLWGRGPSSLFPHPIISSKLP